MTATGPEPTRAPTGAASPRRRDGWSKAGGRWTHELVGYALDRFHRLHLRTPPVRELRAGVDDGGVAKRLEFATGEGFMQALPDRLTVLVDEALQRDAIDPAAARAEREAALERQRALTPQTAEYAREQSIVDFATAKLTLAG